MNKKIVTILLLIFLIISNTYGQSIIQEIRREYHALDSLSYIDRANRSICKFLFGNNLWENEDCFKTRNEIQVNCKAIFLLNVDIDFAKLNTEQYVKVDTNELRFSLLFLKGKNVKDKFCFSNNNYYPFETKINNVKKVLRRNPEFLLCCIHLPWTQLYVLENKIFVYQTLTGKTCELKEYLEEEPSRILYK